MVYTQLQGIKVKNLGWVGAEEAKSAVLDSMKLYREKFPPTGV
jgi:hypothetical protein